MVLFMKSTIVEEISNEKLVTLIVESKSQKQKFRKSAFKVDSYRFSNSVSLVTVGVTHPSRS